MGEILLAILAGPPLWLAGAIVFDGVHWVLHGMLRSRSALLRRLARPHGVHHEWIDRDLNTNWALQSANTWCHIVPEYATQLVFTGLVALALPLPFTAVLLVLQTAVFLGILAARGRDVNHRPAARIDAHPPGWRTPPSYHALHHAWPDAHFSSYTKLVDRIVGGGVQIEGRRFGWQGPDSALAAALRARVERAGGRTASREEPDVLVLLDPVAALDGPAEAFIGATRDRQLPPEIWALRASGADAVARYYRDDVRVVFRTLVVPAGDLSPAAAERAVRRALFWIRRDAHFVWLEQPLVLAAFRRFLRTGPRSPAGATPVRHRLELAAD